MEHLFNVSTQLLLVNFPWLVTRRQCSDISESLESGLKLLPRSAEEAWSGESVASVSTGSFFLNRLVLISSVLNYV